MLVNRRVIKVKVGCMDSIVELLKREEDKMPEKIPYEILVPNFGTWETVVWEGRFESLAQYEQFWGAWIAQESTAEFFKVWDTLIEPGGTNELWEVR